MSDQMKTLYMDGVHDDTPALMDLKNGKVVLKDGKPFDGRDGLEMRDRILTLSGNLGLLLKSGAVNTVHFPRKR